MNKYQRKAITLPGCGRCSRIEYHPADAADRIEVWSRLTIAVSARKRNGTSPLAVQIAQLETHGLPYAEAWTTNGGYYIAVPQADTELASGEPVEPDDTDTIAINRARVLEIIDARKRARMLGWHTDMAASVSVGLRCTSGLSEWRRGARAGRRTIGVTYRRAKMYASSLGVSVDDLRIRDGADRRG